MSLTSNAVSVTVTAPPPTVPLWWADDTAHPVGSWRAYASGTAGVATAQKGNRIADASPTTGSGIFAYSGMATEQETKRCFLMGGGHFDYYGNEVLKLDLSLNVPAWSLFLAKTAASAASEGVADPLNNNRGQTLSDINLGNGRPSSSHTTNVPLCHNGKLWIGQLWGTNPSGADTLQSTARFSMDTTTGVWTAYGRTVATYPWNNPGQGPPNVIVKSRNEYWGGYDHQTATDPITYKMSTLTGAVTTYVRGGTVTHTGTAYTLLVGQARFVAYGCAVEIYPAGARPAFIFTSNYVNGQKPSGHFLIDPAAPHNMWGVTFNNTSGIPYMSDLTSYSLLSRGSMHHLIGTNKIYCLSAPWDTNNLSRFLKLTIPTGDTGATLSATPWNLTLVTPTGTGPGTNLTDQIYGRFTLIQDMGDGRPAIVVVPNGVTSSVYVLKMPAGGL